MPTITLAANAVFEIVATCKDDAVGELGDDSSTIRVRVKIRTDGEPIEETVQLKIPKTVDLVGLQEFLQKLRKGSELVLQCKIVAPNLETKKARIGNIVVEVQ
jgi:hypothetical protein